MKAFYLVCVLFCNIFVKTQSLKVDYDLIRKTTISSDKQFTKEFSAKIIESEKKPEKYVLYFVNDDSFFKSIPTEKIEYENAPEIVGGYKKTVVEVAVKIPVKIYKLKSENKTYAYTNKEGEEFYKLVPKLNFSSVQYKDDTLKIDNFTCKLVEVTNTTGSIVKVWYTEDLPISTGPFGYTDFPGVVLKVETPTFVMYATKINNDVTTKDIEKMDNKLKKID
ncbi:GLPGLI family protein [Chryseobacterium sp. RG1]|uniref:GLPGLI family protein n=1 Tax=Chryseobacterium tagetis TaxID=2801334 RepID=A0ABS7ZV16_9FLAO|nr:GLPGLI family protein [Chryseobacterium tagetis]MCA6065593.1 GLPGLI family protein [Chryseobacterium tagetis]